MAERFGLMHIAPGDIFRQEVREGTELGRLVEGIMAEVRLVPDDITTQIIDKRINSREPKTVLYWTDSPGTWPRLRHSPRSCEPETMGSVWSLTW